MKVDINDDLTDLTHFCSEMLVRICGRHIQSLHNILSGPNVSNDQKIHKKLETLTEIQEHRNKYGIFM